MSTPILTAPASFEHDVQQHIAHDLRAIPLDSARHIRLKNRILNALQPKPDGLLLHNDAAFKTVMPGVSVRKLRDADGSMIALWKLKQGARIPKHGHISDEACLVLDGRLEHAGRILEKGDFLCAGVGEDQLPIVALYPSLLLIRGESRF